MTKDRGSIKTATVRTKYGTMDYGRGNRTRLISVRTLVRLSFLVAVSFLLMLFVEFPVPPFPGHLKYSPADVPGLIGTFALGPVAGVLIQLGKVVLYFFLSGKGEPVGVTANFVASSVWMAVAGLVYLRCRSRLGAALGIGIGAVVSIVVMIPANVYLFLPAYGIPREVIPGLLLPIVWFNLFKALISGLITFLLYKRVKRWL